MTYVQLYADNYEIITIISLPFHNASLQYETEIVKKYIYMYEMHKCTHCPKFFV